MHVKTLSGESIFSLQKVKYRRRKVVYKKKFFFLVVRLFSHLVAWSQNSRIWKICGITVYTYVKDQLSGAKRQALYEPGGFTSTAAAGPPTVLTAKMCTSSSSS